MSVFNITYGDNLPDSAFRSLINPATNNNIQIANYLKNKVSNPDFDIYRFYTTTFKSNSIKPKSYTKNSEKKSYNLISLTSTRNNFSSAIGNLSTSEICSTSEDCAICEDGSLIPTYCYWEAEFNPDLKVRPAFVDDITNNWYISKEDIDDNAINKSNTNISFKVSVKESNRNFNVKIYLKTKKCREKNYTFSGQNTLSSSFLTPEFDGADDKIVEFYFSIITTDCVGNIEYTDDDVVTCTTSVTIPTPQPS